MPEILGHHHDAFVSHYLRTMKGVHINTERFLLGLHKTGYIIPFTIFIKVIENSAKQ